jgi:hypothetical protein
MVLSVAVLKIFLRFVSDHLFTVFSLATQRFSSRPFQVEAKDQIELSLEAVAPMRRRSALLRRPEPEPQTWRGVFSPTYNGRLCSHSKSRFGLGNCLVYSVPRGFLESLLNQRMQSRLRLLPPYREHLSQAFARFFMRVGLPVPIALPSF